MIEYRRETTLEYNFIKNSKHLFYIWLTFMATVPDILMSLPNNVPLIIKISSVILELLHIISVLSLNGVSRSHVVAYFFN